MITNSLQVNLNLVQENQIEDAVMKMVPPERIANILNIPVQSVKEALKDERHPISLCIDKALYLLEESLGVHWTENPKKLTVDELHALEYKVHQYKARVKIFMYA